MALTKITNSAIADDIGLGGNPTTSTQTAGDSTTRIATTAFVSTAVANLVDSAPETLNTLAELATSIGNNATLSSTLTSSIATKLPLAGGTMTGNLNLGDNVRARFGLDSDLQIYHDGSNSYINESGTGALVLQSAGPAIVLEKTNGENMILANTDGAVTLYYNGSAKIATTSTGIDVTGTATMDGLIVNGNNDIQINRDGVSTAKIFWDRSGTTDAFLEVDSGENLTLAVDEAQLGSRLLLLRNNQTNVVSVSSSGINVTGNIGVTGTVDGIDIAARDAVLTSTTTTAGAALPKAGGTMTGNIQLNNAIELRTLDTGGNARTIVRANSSNELEYGWSANAPVKFMGGGSYTERMRIHTNGNIAINHTSAPHTLTVKGTISRLNSSGIQVTNLQTNNDNGQIAILNSGGVQKVLIDSNGGSTFNGGAVYFTGGNVGIGTTTPNAKLTVRNSTTATDTIVASAGLAVAGNYHNLLLADGANYAVGLRRHITVSNPSYLNPRLDFFVQNTSTYLPADRGVKMTILGSGNVGIGTTSPESLLTIQNDDAGIRLRSNTTTAKGLTLRYNHAGNFGQLLVDHQGNNQLAMKYYALSHSFGRSDSDVNVIMDDSGRLLVGSTTTDASTSERFLVKSTGGEHSRFVNSSDTYTTVYIKNTSTTANTNQPFLTFQDTGGNRGNLGLRYSTAQLVIQGHGGVGIAGGSGFNQDPDLFVNTSGNVGIGTSSPDYKLDVTGPTGSYVNGDLPIAVFQSSTDHRALVKVQNNNENDGASAPRAGFDLDVKDEASGNRIRSILTLTKRTNGNAYGNTDLTVPYDFNIFVNNKGTINTSSGAQASSSVTAGDLAMSINASGNVGIGTSSPTGYRLVVENTSEDLLKLHNSTDGLDSLISFTNPGGTLGRVQGIDNGGLGFDVGNNAGGIISNAMSIANTGRVGVGVTQTDPVKFEVNSGTGEHNVMRIRFSDDNNSNATANPFSYEYKSLEIENQYSGAAPSANGTKVAKLQLTTVTAGGYAASSSIMGVAESNGHEAGAMVFATGPNSSGNEVERMRISRLGNVGIGRTDPQQLLEVHKAAGGDQTVAKFSAHNYGDTGKTFIEIGTEYGDGSSRIGSFNDTGNKSVLVFDTHDATSGAFAERMRITSAGKVAIGAGGAGTSGTHTKLEVHGAIAAGSTQGTGGSLVLYQRYGVNDMPATLSTHYSNSYWFLATGMKARSGAAGYVSSLGNYSTARAGIDVNNSSIKFLYVPAATVAVDTVLTPSTPFDMNLDTGTLMLTNGASGTSNGIVFKETNNSDLNKYIKQTAYYMQYNGHPNEGHHFTTSGSQSQLRIHGPTNGTRPSSVDVTATNGLYVNNAQRIESDGTMKPSALEIGVQNIGATLGAYHGKVVHSASNGFTMHQYSKYFESWNATTGVVIDVLETSNDTANWNGNKSIIIEVRQSSYNGGGYARYYFNNQYDENSLETIDASAGADSNTPLSVTGLTVVTGNVKKSKVQITLGYYQQAYVTVYSTMTTSSSITAANQLRFL